MTIRDDAVRLGREGIPVFPCSATKAPLTPRGFHDATTDAETLDWRTAAFIGMPVPTGVLVVDIDPRHDGGATVAEHRRAGRRLPPTYTVRTPGGGGHRYYRTDADLRGGANSLGDGVDARIGGLHYVIVPPSPGYEVTDETAMAAAPRWIIDLLSADRGARDASEERVYEGEGGGSAYGLRGLENECGRIAGAVEGERNDVLNRAAFSVAQLVAGGELDERHARGRLEEEAERLLGSLDRHDEGTLESGWRAGLREPRSAPERPDRFRPTRQPRETSASVLGDPGAIQRGPGLSAPDDEAQRWADWEVDEPPPPFYLWPVVPRNAYVLVYGPTGAAKSIVLAHLGKEASCHGLRVTVYSLENPPHVDRDRLRRLRPCRDNFRLTNLPMDLSDVRQAEALVKRERDWGDGRGSDLVVIDTYEHAWRAGTDDGNAKAIAFAQVVRWAMAETGASFIVVDHTGYAQSGEPRDGSAKRQQVDVAIAMKPNGAWRVGQPASFTMENMKASRFANPFLLHGNVMDGSERRLYIEWSVAAQQELRWDV